MRESYRDGTPYEDRFGFARAVRAGNMVFVSGTVGWGADGSPPSGDMYEQMKAAIRNVEAVLARAGASLGDVVRTRTFTTDISRFDDLARAHREAFGDVRPASSVVEVSRLASPEMLVEIEADAVLPEQS